MEIEQDINHILEVLSSQSPKVALRTIKRLEDRLYKLREDILIREASGLSKLKAKAGTEDATWERNTLKEKPNVPEVFCQIDGG